jgi:hypothetical protein
MWSSGISATLSALSLTVVAPSQSGELLATGLVVTNFGSISPEVGTYGFSNAVLDNGLGDNLNLSASSLLQQGNTGDTTSLTPGGLEFTAGSNYTQFSPTQMYQSSGVASTTIQPNVISLGASVANTYMVMTASYLIYEYYSGTTLKQFAITDANFTATYTIASVVQSSVAITTTDTTWLAGTNNIVVTPTGLVATSSTQSSTIAAYGITTPSLNVTGNASLGALTMSVPTVQGSVTMVWNAGISNYAVSSAAGYTSGATYNSSTGVLTAIIPVGVLTDYKKLIVRGRGWVTVTGGTYYLNEVFLEPVNMAFTSYYDISFAFNVVLVSSGINTTLSSSGYMLIEYLWST